MKFSLLYERETPRPWHALSEYQGVGPDGPRS
jgi:hypothetical protein